MQVKESWLCGYLPKALLAGLALMYARFVVAVESVTSEEMAGGVSWSYVSGNGETLLVGKWDVVLVDGAGRSDNFYWYPDEVATGFGFDKDIAAAIPANTVGAVSIPQSLGGFPVSTIGRHAFNACSNITSIVIPASVKHIAAGAFNGCSKLGEILVATGNESYKTVNGLLLTADGSRLVAAPKTLKTANIPSSVKRIDDFAFFGCSDLASVTIHEGVVSIGCKAFFGCSSLGNVVLPSSFTEFGELAQTHGEWSVDYEYDEPEYSWRWGQWDEYYESRQDAAWEAFANCRSLKAITVAGGNASFKSVGGILYTADGETLVCCPGGIGAVEIGGLTAKIAACAFSGCLSLDRVTIGKSVEELGVCAFLGCASLIDVTFAPRESRIVCGDGAFAWCTALERVALPPTVVGDRMFHSSSSGGKGGDDEPDAPVCAIPAVMFCHCHNLKEAELPAQVAEIGSHAFQSCWALESIVLPESLDYIDFGAFAFCERLRTVTFQGDVSPSGLSDEEFRADVFCRTPYLESLTPFGLEIENGVLVGFSGCCPEELTIPSGVTEIGDSAFDYDENVSVLGLKKLTFPVGLKRVGKWAFFWAGLEEVKLPEGVTELGEGAFLSCTNMVSLSLPQSLTALSPSAFRNCGSLREIVIPKSVSEFGERALAYCVGLEKLVFKGNAPKCGENAFLEVNPSCIVYVSKGSSGWGVPIPGVWNELRIEYTADGGTTPVKPTPTPTPTPTPEPVVVPELYEEVDGAASALASVYDGYLYNKESGALAGTIQVKVGKPNAKTGLASVKATVVVGGAKKSLKAEEKGKAAVAGNGPTTVVLAGGEPCEVTLGAEGLSGFYGAYAIDGSRNFFTSKDKSEANAANDVIAQWIGVVNVVWDGGVASVSIAKKGKVKASVTLANGTKAAANTQLLIGDEWLCVPVVVTKKANIAFTLWLPRDSGAAVVEGLPNGADAGKAGALKSGAAFKFDASALAAALGDATYAAQLPDGLSVEQDGKKWVVAGGAKAGKVQLARGAASPADIDWAKAGANPSALKLTYKAKSGTFNGTFKAYVLANGKPKATTVNVSGILIGDKGYGMLSVKKPSIGLTFEIK